MVIDGKKHWVNVYQKLDRNGNRYVSVNVRPWAESKAVRTGPETSSPIPYSKFREE
jgi:hypothetical protein